MTVVEQIRRNLSALEPHHLEIHDESALHAGHAGTKDGGGHFRLNIVSRHFAGLGTMQRHRMVYAALETLMKSAIHALSIDARTPDEV